MSRNLNRADLIGHLGADPEVRSTSGGTRVAEISVATSRRWTDKAGRQQEKTEWHRVVAWAALAEVAEKYARKGDRIYISGEIQYRTYEDKEGITRYVTEIHARDLILLGGGKKQEPRQRTYDDDPPPFPDDGDLPF